MIPFVHLQRGIYGLGVILSLCVGAFAVHALFFAPVVYRTTPTDIAKEEGRWAEKIASRGGEAAYEDLALAVQKLPPKNQHVVAHIFGGALYDELGLSGLSVCDTRFLYGCFHEFLSRAIVEHGLSIIPSLEEQCLSSPYADAPLSCEHGLGHGIVAYAGYGREELDQAIEVCKTLKHDPIGACFEGVFMEYNLRFFSAPDESDARPVPESDPYDPCAAYGGLVAKRCVGLLPLWWRVSVFSGKVTDETFIWAGEKCDALPPALTLYRSTCFRGVGFIVVTAGAPDRERVERLCRISTRQESDFLECILYGTITLKNALGVEGGAALCMSVPEDMRPMCEEYARTEQLI